MKTLFGLGYLDIRDLRNAAQKHGAGEAELAAIDRLEDFRAENVDIERLKPLAKLAGMEITKRWKQKRPEKKTESAPLKFYKVETKDNQGRPAVEFRSEPAEFLIWNDIGDSWTLQQFDPRQPSKWTAISTHEGVREAKDAARARWEAGIKLGGGVR